VQQSGVVLHVEREQQRTVELRCELGDTLLEAFVLEGEGEFSALAMHRLGDAVGDRAIAQQARDQNAFTGEKSHCRYGSVMMIERL
jgi:hypothetical protein